MPAFDRHLRRALCLVAALAAAAPAAEPSSVAALVAESVLRCTVGISCTTTDGGSFSGTGMVITPQGHVLTSTSVVPVGARDVRVLFPGFVRRDATVVAVDDALAAALIKVDAERLPCLPLARDLPALGTTTYTGSDVDEVLLSNGRASFSRGVVSGIYEVQRQGENGYAGPVLETTAAVNSGSDGGPLVDEKGRVCGVLSVGVSPLRWQGVAVPVTVLRERFAALRAGDLSIDDAPLATLADADGASSTDARLAGLQAAAAALAPYMVGVEVEREQAPERLPLVSWREHQATITGWDKLSDEQRRQRFAAFANQARAFEVNQLLRRPPGLLTGLVVSADGFVLTSLFNVGDDTAFVSRKTGKPREFATALPLEQLVADPEGGFEQRPNAIRTVTVILSDGSRRQATIHARHEPLGIALLKIEAQGLPWYDLAAAAVSPQLGDPVAVLGYLATGPARYTFNTGVVSAPARNRGQQFQTDALLNYGNSGGPVCDAAGNFLGIAAAPIEPDTVLGRLFTLPQLMRWTRAPNSGVGMVARADRIRGVFEALTSGRSFTRNPGPFMGVQADPSRAFGEDVVIGGVSPGSPAERAGMKKGDVVLEFDGEELRNWRDLSDRIAARKAGDTVRLTVRRRGSGARLVIAGRDVETLEDLQRLRRSLKPGDTFQGALTADDTREIEVVLEENK